MASHVDEMHADRGRLNEGSPATLNPMTATIAAMRDTLNQLDPRIGALAPLVHSLAIDVDKATDQIPDRSGPGVIERAKAFASLG